MDGGINTYGYALQNPLIYTDPNGLNPLAICLIPGVNAACAAAGSAIAAGGKALLGGVVIAATIALSGDSAQEEECKENDCPPCRTRSGKTVPVGTIAYRPLDVLPGDTVQHGVSGSHYNIYKANQNPNNCQCFWQPVGAVSPADLPPGAIPIEPFAS